jgi:hypothetical protein
LQKEPKSGFLGCDISDITARLVTYVAFVANITYGYRRPLHGLWDNSNKVSPSKHESRCEVLSRAPRYPTLRKKREGWGTQWSLGQDRISI